MHRKYWVSSALDLFLAPSLYVVKIHFQLNTFVLIFFEGALKIIANDRIQQIPPRKAIKLALPLSRSVKTL